MKTRFHQRRHGMALVITLTLIVLITILVVGLNESMRLDRPTAKLYLENVQATQFAQMGVDSVVATFRKEASDIDATSGRNWIARPGQLIVGGTGAAGLTLQPTSVPLFSGSSSFAGAAALTGTESCFNPPNLNIPTFRSGTNCLITDMPDAANPAIPVRLQVKWVYVRKDGGFDFAEKPILSGTNPIVGRYAYWSDDESSKVNYNIAWGRSSANTNPAGHLTKVDLTALQAPAPALNGTAVDALRSFVLTGTSGNSLMPAATGTNYFFFNTPEDARRVTEARDGLQAHRFEVTHYNHDPDTTFFNEPRIVLTTRPDRAGWKYDGNKWVGKNGLTGTNGRPYYIRVVANEGTTSNPSQPIPPPPAHASNVADTPDPRDPGTMANLDTVLNGKVDDTIRFLIGYLQRTDWPMLSATNSIQSKYYTSSYGFAYPTAPTDYRTKRLAQLAINIIDYVRSKESPLDLVEPMRACESSANPGHYLTGASAPNNASGLWGSLAYIGQTRAPRVTEIGCWMDADNIKRKWIVELYLPRNYGIPSVALNTLGLTIKNTTSGIGASYAQDTYALNLTSPRTGPMPPAVSFSPTPAVLTSGTYLTVTINGAYAAATTTGVTVIANGTNSSFPSGAPRPQSVDVRVEFYGQYDGRMYGLSPVGLGGKAGQAYNLSGSNWVTNPNTWVQCPVDPSGTPIGSIRSVEVDDPRLNISRSDWVPTSSGNTFGSANSNSSLRSPGTPSVPTGEPQQDTDASGNISTASLYMPPPAGKTFTLMSGAVDDNTLGMVFSAGELGYIHTGIECSSYVFNPANNTTVTGTIPKGVPWRTLRLQPNRDGTNIVPDWAFIDLFSAPVIAPEGAEYVYSPGAKDTTGRANAVGGRVNLNCKPNHPSITRTQPLAAVLQGCTYDCSTSAKLTSGSAAALAQNIYNATLGTGGKQYGYQGGYDSPGEVVEIKGIADQGENSEELVRQIANLITTRGNVFSVYSIGQALKQTPNGRILVTGEQRLQAMVERIEYTDPADSKRKVRFAPVYFRNLTP